MGKKVVFLHIFYNAFSEKTRIQPLFSTKIFEKNIKSAIIELYEQQLHLGCEKREGIIWTLNSWKLSPMWLS